MSRCRWQDSDDLICRPPTFRAFSEGGVCRLTFHVYGIGDLIVLLDPEEPLISTIGDPPPEPEKT